MRLRLVAAVAGIMSLAFPAVASAGRVTHDASRITFQADPSAGESVDVGVENGMAFVDSSQDITSSDCGAQTDPKRVECPLTPAFVVNLLDSDDRVSGRLVTGSATLEAHGGAGGDSLTGTPNADLLDGGPGDDTFIDGAGADTVIGGPGNDTWTAGAGSDTFSGGDGTDTVEYRDRTAGVTITLDGRPDDGEAGELDNVGADVEEVSGGSGNDTIFAGANSVRLHGGGGNDTMKGSPQEDRVEGEEGDDTIDTRDGRYDSVDCGPGNDTLFADPGDDATGCEVAPDRDGDGTLNQFDCQPDNPAVHPGAGEIVGNDVDEDCLDGPGYLRVEAGVTFRFVVRKRPPRIRFATLRVSDLKSGDRVEVRCSGKGCAFKRKVIVARTKRLNLAPRFKRRFLRRGAVVEIRILRANFEAKVFRLRVTAGPDVRQTRLCMKPRETTPRTCG